MSRNEYLTGPKSTLSLIEIYPAHEYSVSSSLKLGISPASAFA
jgi:hypothetical protein